MRVSHQKLREKPWRAKSPCAYPRAVQSATRTSPRNGVLCEGLLAGRVLLPGRARLATRPSLTGSCARPKTIGIVAVAALAARAPSPKPGVVITATRRRTSLSDERRQAVVLAIQPVV